MSKSLRIAISIGDPNGIGPEVACKAMLNKALWRGSRPILYAHRSLIEQTILSVGKFDYQVIESADQATSDGIFLIEPWDSEFIPSVGLPSLEAGMCALKSLERATDDLVGKQVSALVTAPIDKHSIQSDSFTFPGHTEYLAMRDGSDALMFLVTDSLRVGIVTGHIPVSEIASTISQESIINKLKMMQQSLQQDFGIANPRIAVFGLNPHAGDQGLIGQDEINTIIPAIKKARTLGIGAEGPFPADGFFGAKQHQSFDALLAMYHDQGLVPFKALSFGGGVNYTAGLSIVRTSPDHGTAYTIAGQGIADSRSFEAAFTAAKSIIHHRASRAI